MRGAHFRYGEPDLLPHLFIGLDQLYNADDARNWHMVDYAKALAALNRIKTAAEKRAATRALSSKVSAEADTGGQKQIK